MHVELKVELSESKDIVQPQLDRLNKLSTAIAAETDRGVAIVGDAVVDELLGGVFPRRFLNSSKLASELLGDHGPLGSHGSRLKLSYCLGWLGAKTYADCQIIHRIRNRMAHDMDADTFDHERVRDFVEGLHAPTKIKVNVPSRRWRFSWSIIHACAQLLALQQTSTHATPPPDFEVAKLLD